MSEVGKEKFIENYAKEIIRGDATAFVGAGMSIPSGFVDWKKLIEPFSNEVGLSIKKENNYIAIAQYFLNKKKK